jgi:hypothetical protein
MLVHYYPEPSAPSGDPGWQKEAEKEAQGETLEDFISSQAIPTLQEANDSPIREMKQGKHDLATACSKDLLKSEI